MLTAKQAAERLFGQKEGYSSAEWKQANAAVKLLQREQELLKEEYQRYLRSERWRKLCALVRKRDNYKCRFCGRKGTQIHHLTYARIFREEIYDLVLTCDDCHKLLHKLDFK